MGNEAVENVDSAPYKNNHAAQTQKNKLNRRKVEMECGGFSELNNNMKLIILSATLLKEEISSTLCVCHSNGSYT